MVMSYGWKGRRNYNIRKAYVLPFYGMKAQIAFYIGTGIGIIVAACITLSLNPRDPLTTWIMGIIAAFLIAIICGPIARCVVAAFLTLRKKYEEAWVISNGVGEVCRVFYITKNTNKYHHKVLKDYLDKYTDKQIEKQTDYFSARYENAFLNIH